jgi:hypothetical protein
MIRPALIAACLSLCALAALAQPAKPAPAKFTVRGVYVESCTCRSTCAGEITGEATGCDVVGAARIDEGSYNGADLAGTRVAFAVDHGDQVHLYLDAPQPKRTALESFARAAFAALGTVKSVADFPIDLSGKDGAYSVKIDGGKVLTLSTEPVLGGDHKTPVAINNTLNALNPTLYQGHSLGARYTDRDRTITIEKGRNAFFNAHMDATGIL